MNAFNPFCKLFSAISKIEEIPLINHHFLWHATIVSFLLIEVDGQEREYSKMESGSRRQRRQERSRLRFWKDEDQGQGTGEHLAKHVTSFCRVTAKDRKRNGKKSKGRKIEKKRDGKRKRERHLIARWQVHSRNLHCTCWRSFHDTNLTRSREYRISSVRAWPF